MNLPLDSCYGKSQLIGSEEQSLRHNMRSMLGYECPFIYLQMLLNRQGNVSIFHSGIESKYRIHPSDEQIRSYDSTLLSAVRTSDVNRLSQLMNEGYVMSACNRFCESILHLACKRSSLEAITFLLENGAELVADDCGRVPLHDLCWRRENSFKIAKLLLRLDPQLVFVADNRGATPLEYVPEHMREAWCDFIQLEWRNFWKCPVS